MKAEILKMLRESQDYVSGQQICERFQVSRTAVWKVIKQLKEEGYEVEAVRNRGYRLSSLPDILSREEIVSQIDTVWAGQNVYYFTETDSTNIQAKRMGDQGGASRNSGSSRTADCRKRQKRKNLGVSGGSEYLYVTSFASGDRTGQSTHVDSGYGICGCNGASGMYGSGCTD